MHRIFDLLRAVCEHLLMSLAAFIIILCDRHGLSVGLRDHPVPLMPSEY